MSQVATIGFFDGVHRGHCSLLSQVVRQAAQRNRQSTVVTFDIHPRQLVNPDFQPLLLTTLDEKLQLLSLQGIDSVAVLHFDEQMASLSARDFMSVVLSRQLNVDTLVLGYDSRFGHGRTAGFADYEAYGHSMGIDVLRATPLLSDDGTPVSSSLVRNLLLSLPRRPPPRFPNCQPCPCRPSAACSRQGSLCCVGRAGGVQRAYAGHDEHRDTSYLQW